MEFASESGILNLIFSGVHCSGKTTRSKLAYTTLRKAGFSVEYRTDNIRSCPYPLNEQGSYISQKWILSFFRERDLKETNSDIVIMDRCSIDTIPYTLYLYEKGRITRKECDLLVQEAKEIYYQISGKKIVFYCEPLPIVDNGFRSVDEEYRSFIATKFEYALRFIPDRIVRISNISEDFFIMVLFESLKETRIRRSTQANH